MDAACCVVGDPSVLLCDSDRGGVPPLAWLEVWRPCLENKACVIVLRCGWYVCSFWTRCWGRKLNFDCCTERGLLVVAARKKIRIHTWNESSRKFEHHKDHVLNDEPLSVVWTGSSLLVGYKDTYVAMDLDSGDTRRMFETGHAAAASGFVPRSVATVLPDVVRLLFTSMWESGLSCSDIPTKARAPALCGALGPCLCAVCIQNKLFRMTREKDKQWCGRPRRWWSKVQKLVHKEFS